MPGNYSVAVDLGASGGKLAAGQFDGEKVSLSDSFVFANIPVNLRGTLYWDVFGLYKSILNGLSKYGAEFGKASTVAIDTWGATYGLLDRKGRLLEPVYHYRDSRTENTLEEMYRSVSKKELFEMTGCQCARTYTLPQLYSCVLSGDPCLESAEKLLLLPDLLGYFLSGSTSTEMTIAGTSALMDRTQEHWNTELLKKFSIPTHLLTEIVDAGTCKGILDPNAADSTGIGRARLVAAVSHDSAAAVAAIPGFGPNKLYVSIGTNVSMGIERDEPLISDEAFYGGFKNTGGIGRKKIVYRDFAAFWIINELRREWRKKQIDCSFDELHRLAGLAKSVNSYIDPENPLFNSSEGNMEEKITGYLQKTGQTIPETVGEFVRCVFESLAMKIKASADYLKSELNVPLTEAFAINGGARNELLVQMISDALGIRVKAGLPYATIAGNLLTQLLSEGQVSSLSQMREVSARSFRLKEYAPAPSKDWDGEFLRAKEMHIFP